MSMTREGCGDRFESYGSEDAAERCERCGWKTHNCTCAACAGCTELVDSGRLAQSADGSWRCPPCHLRATMKLHAGEHPVFQYRARDLIRTVEQPAFTMAELVYGLVR